ncbi:MAG: bifunctional UDP-N-acetylglucosamine diphosphorylase/glucosamine-1-phosphate N-acetyltransferase GlmU [Xanthomonadaceae bacterium]|nr:bifunctional UDP-N-acetylglucosamine diphosphorylase/glucosamine-1-phosphate N-acetyltransferase GlmU [Xanthomonadaceae bacterium]
MSLTVIILAAGQGKRMHSALPKVLQPLAGQPLLGHVLATARALKPSEVRVVHGHGAERVRAAFPDGQITWVSQDEQLGTGHAVMQAMPGIPDGHTVLVLCGDVPLVRAESLRALVAAASDAIALLTVDLVDPSGYGRIVRNTAGGVVRIVEHRDATEEERQITETNTGIMAMPAARLAGWLKRLGNDNSQGEYYLTDVIALAVADGVAVNAVKAENEAEVAGVNDRRQLARVERVLQRALADALLERGVTIVDPARFDLRGTLKCGRDVTIDVNCVFEGEVELGDNVTIGPNCVIQNAVIGDGCTVGPFARIRPGTVLDAGAKVGNFVEVKNAHLAAGAKVPHLSYVGDTEVGAGANVGAGTITCNYDGANKHRTVIGAGAFIGSNSALVAPVRIGDNATIGAGSVVTKDAPAGELTLARGKQTTIKGWKRPTKDKG